MTTARAVDLSTPDAREAYVRALLPGWLEERSADVLQRIRAADPTSLVRMLTQYKADLERIAKETPVNEPQNDTQTPPKPTKLTEVDRLRLENTSLKLMNIGVQFEKLSQERLRFSKQFDDLRKECLERYGIDIATTRIDEEGNFLGPLPMPGQAQKA
jgi:hypothetical protein